MPKIFLTYLPGENNTMLPLIKAFAPNVRQLVADGMNEFYGAHKRPRVSIDELGLRVVTGSGLDENYPPIEISIHSSASADGLALRKPSWLLQETVKPILRWFATAPLAERFSPEFDTEYIINGQHFGCTVQPSGHVVSHWPQTMDFCQRIEAELAPPR